MYNRSSDNQRRGGFKGGNYQRFRGESSNGTNTNNRDSYGRDYDGNNANSIRENRGETSQDRYDNERDVSSYGRQFDRPNNGFRGQDNQEYSSQARSPVHRQGRNRRSPSPSHGSFEKFQKPRSQPCFGSRSPSPRRGNQSGRSQAQNYSNQRHFPSRQRSAYSGPVVHISDSDIEDEVDSETLISMVRAKLMEDQKQAEEETRRLYRNNPDARPNPFVFEEMPHFELEPHSKNE